MFKEGASRNPRSRLLVPPVVQQRQYRVSILLTVFFAVVGAVMVVVDVAVVAVAASQLQQGGMSGVVVGSTLVLVGALFIAVALRPSTLTVDDGGLHLRNSLARTRVISWSLVRSFRAQSGGRGWCYVRVELDTGKKVVLPGIQVSHDRAERIAAELTAAHRELLADGID